MQVIKHTFFETGFFSNNKSPLKQRKQLRILFLRFVKKQITANRRVDFDHFTTYSIDPRFFPSGRLLAAFCKCFKKVLSK